MFGTCAGLWSTASTCISINKFDVLNASSGFNYNLRVQLFFGAFFAVLLAVLGLAYLVSTHRNYTAYLAYEFDPSVDGFADDDQYKLRGGRFWLRVFGCKRLPKEKRELIREHELDAAAAAAPQSATDADVSIGFESSSGGSSTDGNESDGGSAASLPDFEVPEYNTVVRPSFDAPSTPPLGSAPPPSEWDHVNFSALPAIENGDLPIASPRTPETPPLEFGMGEAPPPLTPPLEDAGGYHHEPSTPPPPMPAAYAVSRAAMAASVVPPVAVPLIPPSEYEDLWDTYPRLGGFKAEVSLNPSLPEIRSHLETCNLVLSASGTTDGASTVFAHVARCAPGATAQCLVKLQFDHDNQRLKIVFKGPADLDVSGIAAGLRLGELFGSIGE